MAFNLPPGFGTRRGDRDHFEDPDRDPDGHRYRPAPDPETWREAED